jgi:hypothetical protein
VFLLPFLSFGPFFLLLVEFTFQEINDVDYHQKNSNI